MYFINPKTLKESFCKGDVFSIAYLSRDFGPVMPYKRTRQMLQQSYRGKIYLDIYNQEVVYEGIYTVQEALERYCLPDEKTVYSISVIGQDTHIKKDWVATGYANLLYDSNVLFRLDREDLYKEFAFILTKEDAERIPTNRKDLVYTLRPDLIQYDTDSMLFYDHLSTETVLNSLYHNCSVDFIFKEHPFLVYILPENLEHLLTEERAEQMVMDDPWSVGGFPRNKEFPKRVITAMYSYIKKLETYNTLIPVFDRKELNWRYEEITSVVWTDKNQTYSVEKGTDAEDFIGSFETDSCLPVVVECKIENGVLLMTSMK